jgi:hypothetical protein
MLKSTNQRLLTLDSFAVRAYLEQVDYASLEYGECMNLLQELLELPQTVGVPLARHGDTVDEKGRPEDFSLFVCEQMIEAGFDADVAYKCRNSAASKAYKIPLKTRQIRDVRVDTRMQLTY